MTIDEKVIPWALAAFTVLLGLLNWLRIRKKDTQKESDTGTELRVDVKYIMRGVDDIRIDQQRMREEMGSQAERITRAEESCKSAHHRLDEHLKKGE